MRSPLRDAKPYSPSRVRSIVLAFATAGLLGWAMTGPAIASPGRVSEFVLAPQTGPSGITVGADGTIWFTQWGTNAIGHLVPGVPA